MKVMTFFYTTMFASFALILIAGISYPQYAKIDIVFTLLFAIAFLLQGLALGVIMATPKREEIRK